MSAVFIAACLCILAFALPYLWRTVRGPTLFDRVIGLNGLGTKVPVVIVLLGLVAEQLEYFVDIALALLLLNLVTTLLFAKYVGERKAGEKGKVTS
jgi:multicomponent Na+:H+ antiporter subunit F